MGFTLIESLLVIAIVGLLVALVGGRVQLVRAKARDIAELAVLRQHASILAAYSTDFRDWNPIYTNPLATRSVIRCRSAGVAVDAPFFAPGEWNIALADGYYDGNPRHPSFRSPHARAGGGSWPTDFDYPCVFVAHPHHFNRATRIAPPTLFAGTRASDVRFASQKCLLVDNGSPSSAAELSPRRAVLAAFCDGHADRAPESRWGEQDRATHAVANEVPRYSWHGGFEPMLHTLDGVWGIDVR